MKILIKNGRLIDPSQGKDDILDLLINGSKISKISKNIDEPVDRIINADKKIVMPGLVDMHVHLRQPGREDKETIASGTKAALTGGVTSVLVMPNTEPSIDCPKMADLLKNIIDKDAKISVFISGSITKERKGKCLADISGLKKRGATVITDDGSSVDDESLMRSAFKEAKKENILIICHSEDKNLAASGVINLGFTSTRLGLRGISKESEYKQVARDIELAREANANIHIAHVSCLESVEIIAKAKAQGVKVTAETAPHYFSLIDEDVEFDANLKMNPPLRGKEDREKIKQALRDGTVDVIASDHAPHTENEKAIEFERAEFGVIGLETMLSVAITELIDTKILTWMELADKLATNPAKILRINKGTLKVGADADIVVVAPAKEWVVDKKNIVSKSKNSCFLGRKLKGVVEYTIFAGNIMYKADN